MLVSKNRYKVISAIFKLVPKEKMERMDLNILKAAISAYKESAECLFSWAAIKVSIEKYTHIIEPPSSVLEACISMGYKDTMEYRKDGVDYLITKQMDCVTWMVI